MSKNVPWKRLFAVALIIFIIFGFGTKLFFTINLDYGSDMTGEGLQAMEIWGHQNYLLSDYYLPSDDTFIFTELLPFQLVPQILSHYNPLVLKLVSFVIFGIAVAALSYIIFLVSGETINALIFAALAANLAPAGYYYFAIPTTHIATIVFLGLMLILLLYMSKNDKELAEKMNKHKKRQAKPSRVQWAYVIVLGILTAMTVLSDTIILTWLIIPLILAYMIFYREKTRNMNLAMVVMAAVSAIAYIFKTNFIKNWVSQSFINLDMAKALSVNLPLSYDSLAIFLDTGLYRVLNGQAFGIVEIVSVVALAALVIYALKKAIEDKDNRFFYGILLISGLLMLASFQVMSLVKDIYEARYFTFTILTVFMIIALAYRKSDKIFGALVVAFLLLSAVYSISSASAQWGHTPNAQEYGLISFLKENNLTYGYGSTWISNTITYLSGEDVTVRPVLFYTDSVKPNVWLGCEQWYRSPPEKAFILVDNSTLDDNGRQVISSLTKSLNASEPLYYENYIIYPTNLPAYKTS